MVLVREAVLADAEALASLHVRAWQAAYRGLMPQAYLDGLQRADWAVGWQRRLSRPRVNDPVLVATIDGVVVGFASFGLDRGGDSRGELYALNIDPDHWGRSAGAHLLSAAQAALADRGHTVASLWVVPGNERARRFYERNGWAPAGEERTEEILGVTVPEVRYERGLDAQQG